MQEKIGPEGFATLCAPLGLTIEGFLDETREGERADYEENAKNKMRVQLGAWSREEPLPK